MELKFDRWKKTDNRKGCLLVIVNVHGIAFLSVIHKASAVLFMALIIVLLVHKAFVISIFESN